ncbi:MAG: beta-phosphoglucomutase family hydrolase [Aeromicrobium sp.]|uniref:HAD family hydrolase n=1 Tax=Aeromicrobium sp. TaxID=1871063 RepID=UPI0039E2836A
MDVSTLDWTDYDAALFDLDGVITPTAEVHMRAWERMFNTFLNERSAEEWGIAEPYTDADYHRYVDGKPRYDGVRSFLASRGVELPEGDPSDGPEAETVCGLGNRKNEVFAALLAEEGVAPYPGSVALVAALAERGVRRAIVSSSRNAPAVLRAAGMIDEFELIVDGVVAAEAGLPGKPAPDTYQHAADLMGVPHARAVVFEDAISGVQAGAAGDFGLVVGVDRGAGADALRDHGADLVVADLEELL